MTKLLKFAVEAARALPPERQDELAHLIIAATEGGQKPAALSPEFIASLRKSLEQADCGQFATDEEVAAVWRKHGL